MSAGVRLRDSGKIILRNRLSLQHEVDPLPQAVGGRSLVAQHVPVDEDGWGSRDADAGAFLHVRSNALFHFGAVQITRKAIDVQTKLIRILGKNRAGIVEVLPRVLIPV